MGKFFIILFCMFLFISCEHCYNCVADGQHAENWLPYIDNQFVTLSSSDNSSKVFKVKKKKTDPSKESCDFVGAGPRMNRGVRRGGAEFFVGWEYSPQV